MEPQLRITYRGYGIADRFSDGSIELNKHLEDYPDLKRAIINHEVRHTNEPKLNKKDFLHDLSKEKFKTWQMMKFMFRHPLSLIQFCPMYWTKHRGWVIDKNLMIIEFGIVFIIGAALFFGIVI